MPAVLLPLLLLAAGPAPADPPETAALRLLGRATRGEPPITQVQRAAAAAALRAIPPPPARGRARRSALLPKVSAELRLDERQYRVVGYNGSSEVDYARETPGAEVSLKLAWELPQLLFHDAELRIDAEARAAEKARAEAVERATDLWFERQRLRVALAADPPLTARERALEELRLEELAARLDALTGGLYSGGAR
jgi:hypothetical protein